MALMLPNIVLAWSELDWLQPTSETAVLWSDARVSVSGERKWERCANLNIPEKCYGRWILMDLCIVLNMRCVLDEKVSVEQKNRCVWKLWPQRNMHQLGIFHLVFMFNKPPYLLHKFCTHFLLLFKTSHHSRVGDLCHLISFSFFFFFFLNHLIRASNPI